MRMNLPVTEHERTFSSDQRLISTTDLNSRITYCNDAFVAISGFTYDEPGRPTPQPGAPPGYAAGGIRAYVGDHQAGQTVDGRGQEPGQERGLLLGQRLCHGDLRAGPHQWLRVGALGAHARADPPCRGAVCPPAQRQGCRAMGGAAGAWAGARLAAVWCGPVVGGWLPVAATLCSTWRADGQPAVGLVPGRAPAEPGHPPHAGRAPQGLYQPAGGADLQRQPRAAGPNSTWPSSARKHDCKRL